MNRIILLILLALGFYISAFSQSGDEKVVANNVVALHKAMIDVDKIGLKNLIAKELSYGHSSGKVDTKATFMESVLAGINDYVTINVTNQVIAVTGKIAIVRHMFNAEIVTNNVSSMAKLGILLIWKKQQGSWKLVARQAFKL